MNDLNVEIFLAQTGVGNERAEIETERAKAEYRTDRWKNKLTPHGASNKFNVLVGNLCADTKEVSSTKSSTYYVLKAYDKG